MTCVNLEASRFVSGETDSPPNWVDPISRHSTTWTTVAVELRNIPTATVITCETASQTESAGGMNWQGVWMTITRDNDGMQLNAAASNGVFRWELHPAHFWDGEGPAMYIGRLIETGAKPNA